MKIEESTICVTAPTLQLGHSEEIQRAFLSFLFHIAMKQHGIHHQMLLVDDIKLVDETRNKEHV